MDTIVRPKQVILWSLWPEEEKEEDDDDDDDDDEDEEEDLDYC
jgi:hypothetical protein